LADIASRKGLSTLCFSLNPVPNPFHTSSGRTEPEVPFRNPSVFSSAISVLSDAARLKKNADPLEIKIREIQARNVELEAYVKKIGLNNDYLLLTAMDRGDHRLRPLYF